MKLELPAGINVAAYSLVDSLFPSPSMSHSLCFSRGYGQHEVGVSSSQVSKLSVACATLTSSLHTFILTMQTRGFPPLTRRCLLCVAHFFFCSFGIDSNK